MCLDLMWSQRSMGYLCMWVLDVHVGVFWDTSQTHRPPPTLVCWMFTLQLAGACGIPPLVWGCEVLIWGWVCGVPMRTNQVVRPRCLQHPQSPRTRGRCTIFWTGMVGGGGLGAFNNTTLTLPHSALV